MMLLKVAWRNIWRSRVRSFVVIGAVMIGVWAFITTTAFTLAMTYGYIENAIRFQTAHIQVHHPKFQDDKELEYMIDDSIFDSVSIREDVKASSKRTIVNGMIRSSRAARGVSIKGINPSLEENLIGIKEKIEEGAYFDESRNNQILISREIADKLKLKVRKKVVLQFQDEDREIIAGSFRVVGIYRTGNTIVDLSSVYVNRKDLNKLIGNDNALHEIAFEINDVDQLEIIQAEIQGQFPETLVENYRQLSPDVQLYESQIYISVTIMLFIFMLALIFGIINTMLMAVLERTKELGMLMAIGMSKLRVFFMIVIETMILGLIGAPLGMLIGQITVKSMYRTGVDLSAFAKGAERFGMDTMIYPFLETQIYYQLMVAVFLTALLASIYPALKAIRLKPMEAIRKI